LPRPSILILSQHQRVLSNGLHAPDLGNYNRAGERICAPWEAAFRRCRI